MKRNLKEEILSKAGELYRERGFDQVSMRDIADGLDISVGNLTYHFKRKEDLVEAVVRRMHDSYRWPQPARNLCRLATLLQDIRSRLQENAYYIWKSSHMETLRPVMVEIQASMVEKSQALLRESFVALWQEGLFRGEAEIGTYSGLVRATLMVSTFWMPQMKMEMEWGGAPDYSETIWGILVPALTGEGMEAYHRDVLQGKL